MPSFPLTRYRDDEDGAMTALNLYFVIVMALFGGLAIDMGNLIAARTQLQIAADSAAHAAIFTRERFDKDVAKAKAIEVAKANMPKSVYGDVLRAENIRFGTWDKASRTFTEDDDNAKGAVYVKTDRLSENSNSVSAFLLQFAGFREFDVVTTSVFETYRPTCLREGFVAQGSVDVQSNNSFVKGFCIHSNTQVSFNQNNTFENGTIVSMPDSANVDLPSSGFEKNEGLKAALRDGSYYIQIVQDLKSGVVEADMLAGLDDNYSLSNVDLKVIEYDAPGGNLEMADLNALMDDGDAATTGDGQFKTYNIKCDGKGTLNIGNAEPFDNVVITTDCDIKFGQSSELRGTTILTRSTSDNSVSAPSGLIIGSNDGCVPGGGAQILTHGSVKNAAKVEMYSGRIIAVGNVGFAAGNNGIEGASVIAGGRIDITSGSEMGFCGSDMDTLFEAEYYRMAG